MKVLHVGKYYPPYMGGIETHLQALCRSLLPSTDVRVVVSNTNGETRVEHMDGLAVCRVGTPFTFASAPVCPGMVSQIKNSAADLVHIHLPNPTAVMAYLASGRRGPLVVTYHSDTVKQKVLGAMFAPFQNALLRRASAILATSQEYLDSSPVLARFRDKCHVVPYGIDIGEFSQADPEEVARIRAEYGERILVAVGRLVYYKGFENLIKAMPRIDGRLLLIGDGPLGPSLKQLADSLGVRNKVVFVGNLPNEVVAPYYQAARIFLLPSVARSEAFGIVQIEAMASGIPVINTQLDSGVPFVSKHGISGLTVPPSDPDALASAVNLLLDDDSLRQKYGANGRLRAHQLFRVETMTEKVLEIYRSVLDGAKVGSGKPASAAQR